MSHMVMLTELLPADKKFIITAVSTFFYTAGHVMLAVFAYFLVNWKHLQLLTGLVSCVYLFFLYFIDESIYWLMAKYKTRKAAKLIVKAARVNHLMHGRGKSYFSYQHVFGSLKKEIERSHHGAIPNIIKNPQDENEALTKNGQGKSLEDRLLNTERSNDIIDLESSHQNNSKKRYWNVVKKRFNAKSGPKKMDVDQKAIANTYNETFSYLYPGNKHLKFLDLVMMPLLRKRTFFAALGTFFLYQLQMALILSIHLLPGDQYINFSLSGLAEIPINIIGLYALSIGRRKPLILFNTITAIAIITRWKIPTNPTLTSNIISISLYLIARSFNGGAFLITFLYISEIYPTEIRNSGYGLNNAISRAGYVIAPFITYLEKYHKAYFPMLMVSFSILSSLFIAYLPATKNKPLPKTIQDLE